MDDCLYTADGRDYVGTTSQTLTGRTCQRWTSQSPHLHFYTGIDMFPDSKDADVTVADVVNYCRNPSLAGTQYLPLPWCYTNSSHVAWEFCNIPRCKGI